MRSRCGIGMYYKIKFSNNKVTLKIILNINQIQIFKTRTVGGYIGFSPFLISKQSVSYNLILSSLNSLCRPFSLRLDYTVYRTIYLMLNLEITCYKPILQ